MDLSRSLNVHYKQVVCWLKEMGIHQLKPRCSEDTKREVIRLYADEKRGKKHIGGLFGKSDVCIANWLTSWGIKTWDRQTIQKVAMGLHGVTPGFKGRKHTPKSKNKISTSGLRAWENDRAPAGNNSHTYNTEVGKVSGRGEVAYLQQFRDLGMPLPMRCGIRIKTPYGTYQPDFETEEAYIEIKSKFTFELGVGTQKSFRSESAVK